MRGSASFRFGLCISFLWQTHIVYEGGAKFDPEKAFRLIKEYKLTNLFMPPTTLRMIRQVSNPSEKFDLRSLRVLASGAEPLGKALREWVAKTFGSQVTIREVYGQSEATPLTVNSLQNFCKNSITSS